MYHKFIYSVVVLMINYTVLTGQVKIRLFAAHDPHYILFSVAEGEYSMNTFLASPEELTRGDLVYISELNGKMAVKLKDHPAIICDSVYFSAKTVKGLFTLRSGNDLPLKQSYTGDLQCHADLETIVMINACDSESYIAGVVRAEGGAGKHIEYYKTQAVIARTYMFKYLDKHEHDRFNLCDNTHCQVFNGITSDTTILRAASETKGRVILGPDSTLIIAAFHSNCGGETAPSGDVWLTDQPYLKKVTDPFCTTSRNASWMTTISKADWLAYLERSGYAGSSESSVLNFSQKTRSKDYKAGSFSLPLSKMRTDLNLRSAFFSVTVSQDSVILNGQGYGHGVGLCQEGAMAMAGKGFDYRQIINFYYNGVFIDDILNAAIE